MEGGGLAVDADVGHGPPGADKPRAQLEGVGDADGFDGHVGAESVGQAP